MGRHHGQLDYMRASGLLTGRCKEQRKLCNNTVLIRRSEDRIAVRLHSTDVITFHANGQIDIYTGGWNTVTTKDRVTGFSPGRLWTESEHAFYTANGQTVALDRDRASIMPDGSLVGASEQEERAKIREERNERNRPRNRARYWTRKAREGKPYTGTIDSILTEENQTVRVAKIRCYGLERFFLDAKSSIIDERNGYQLLSIPLDRWNNMRALKMVCSTTGAVYINTVPPHIGNVPSALDWMYDTKDYLGQITQQA